MLKAPRPRFAPTNRLSASLIFLTIGLGFQRVAPIVQPFGLLRFGIKTQNKTLKQRISVLELVLHMKGKRQHRLFGHEKGPGSSKGDRIQVCKWHVDEGIPNACGRKRSYECSVQ